MTTPARAWTPLGRACRAAAVVGVLYPYLILHLPRYVPWWDRALLAGLPQLLEPLSTSIGAGIALTGMSLPGPTLALLAGVMPAGVLLAIGAVRERRFQHAE